MNYIKFTLKPVDEILKSIEDRDSIHLFSCKKCFKEFSEEETSGCTELTQALSAQNKKIICTEIDFLCNEYLTKKKIAGISLTGINAVGVASCGIGIQLLAELIQDKPVYAFADSISQNNNATAPVAHHGIALYDKKCAACGQCYLNITGGICPIVDCSKSLLNGPCGGAKEGKCEVKLSDGSTKDCAWEKIFKRSPASESVQLRNYSVPQYDFTAKHITENISRRREGFYGGFYPVENKNFTENKQIEIFPEPELLVIPLSQHTGEICRPLVSPGDKVKYGQKIGDSKSFISVPVHSSVSGEVVAVEERAHPVLRKKVLSVVIKNDYKNSPDESLKPAENFENLTREELLKDIREAGVAGLGGAVFPAYVKLQPPKPVDMLLINGCECEPYLTSDYRMMLEQTVKILLGVKILIKILNVKKAVIAIEDNKKNAIEAFNVQRSTFNDKIDIVVVKTKYPQGAERMLIKRVFDREVPVGGLPFDVGVIVHNVSTAAAVCDAVVSKLPLVERIVTVSGENCDKPGNYKIKIGTSFQNIINYCFPKLPADRYSIKMGGPMMGILQTDLDVPVVKGTNGIIAVQKPAIEPDETRKCIKCGRCVDACPMELYPLYFALYAQENKIRELNEHNVKSCIECGCCEYLCSSKIPLVSIVKRAKPVC